MTTETLSREWLQHQISAIEGAGITDSNTLAAFKLALAAMSSKAVVPDEVERVAAVLELIGSFEATDIDSDTVDLRFEIDDVDTGSDVSITEYAARGSAIIRMLAGNIPVNPDSCILEALKNIQTENEVARGQLVILQLTLLKQQRKIAELESRTVTAAAADVLAERQRQVTAEGWTAERDDGYQNSELADAAACYAIHAHNQGFSTPAHWPWSQDWWKQTSPRRDLVKAGALILAEIERLDRAAGIKVEAE
ncbi:hypothetical protein [Raoultella ornithinolytica]|uniref:hypothetical protein n=1 Tax=Raoultella ornithinolytica TaxID=54291 RepID=UPI00384ABDE0